MNFSKLLCLLLVCISIFSSIDALRQFQNKGRTSSTFNTLSNGDYDRYGDYDNDNDNNNHNNYRDNGNSNFKKNGCACGENDIPISQGDVNNKGFNIKKPGKYCLAEDIYYGNPKRAAINVLSDSVTINMNHHKIDLLNSARQGIFLGEVFNIWIYDGIITNSTQKDLTIEDDIIIPIGSNFIYPQLPKKPSAGIYGNGTSKLIIENMLIDKVVYGIIIVNTTGHITLDRIRTPGVGNSSVPEPAFVGSNTIVSAAVGAGIVLFGKNGTDRVDRMQDVSIRRSDIVTQNSRYGILLGSGTGAYIDDVTASAGRPAIAAPINFVVVSAAIEIVDFRQAKIHNCNGRYGNALVQVAYSEGVDIRDFSGAQTSHNGIEYAFSNHSRIENCDIHRIATNEPRNIVGGGVVILAASNIHVKDCVVTDFTVGAPVGNINAVPLIGAGNGCGFRIVASVNSSVSDSVASGNIVGFCDLVGGFALPQPTGNVPIAAVGGQNVFLRNLGEFNQLVNYLGVSPVALYNSPPNTVYVPWINVAHPTL